MEEFSAGGIVFQPQNGQLLVLVSQHSGHHGWVFPKGHVGDTIPGETTEEAAIREVQEETGITGTIIKKLLPTSYWYQYQGEKRHKTVQYFLMTYVSGDTKDHGWEMEQAVWMPEGDIEKTLTYDSDKKVWKEAREKIAQLRD